jgi:hypothetical protein
VPLFPATALTHPVMGLDFHAVSVPPVPVVPMIPHPYFGPLLIWLSPTFPKTNVFINGMPAAAVGTIGYSVHIPSPLPSPPTMANMHSFFVRHLTNVPKALGLAMLTLFANLAIAAIASLIPKPPAVESFIKDVTGIDTSSSASTWNSIKGAFDAYTKWQTWAKLLIPPLPYIGAQGSTAVGSPNVTVNGGPLGFNAPLMAASCSDLQFVPNAAGLGFSNVMVGVSLADMARALAVNAAQAGVSAGVNKAAEAVGGRRSCGCH